MPPRGVGAEEYDQAADHLQKSRPDIVHGLQPILRYDDGPGEIVVDHHTRQNDEHGSQNGQSHHPGQQRHDGTTADRPLAPRPLAVILFPVSMGTGA